MRHKLEQQLATKQEQWSGRGLDKLSVVALSALLDEVDDAAARIRAEQETRRRHARQTLMALIPLCPITHMPMQDPVVDPEGNTYERAAITRWLQTHATSPVTRAPLIVHQLVPNRALRTVIDHMGSATGGAVAGGLR
jgi:hypothetical protein